MVRLAGSMRLELNSKQHAELKEAVESHRLSLLASLEPLGRQKSGSWGVKPVLFSHFSLGSDPAQEADGHK